jgi:NAD(P)-dependent dehydrogenase (short-subunit alcohol dehydrogenase family)
MGILDGQAALITGGGSGIGLACARALLADGATVTICGRSEERLQKAAAELGTERVRWATCDVASEDDVAAAVGIAGEPLGALHMAVANAGASTFGAIVDTPVEEWERVMSVNLTGTFLTIKHAGKAIAEAGGGAIVAVSSIAGAVTHRLLGAYSISKVAIDGLVRNAADELGASNVRVNSVRPGLVPTDMTEMIMGNEGITGDYLDQMPVRRLGTPDDIAAAVRYLLGPESGWVTGQHLSVDGGHHLRRGPDYLKGA